MTRLAPLPHRHPLTCTADGEAHPGLPPETSAPDARPHSVCAETGAPEAQVGVSSLTGDDIDQRFASDVAALSGDGSEPASMGARNAAILSLIRQGVPQTDIAQRFALSSGRICQIYARSVTAEHRAHVQDTTRREALHARADQFFTWYAAGLTLREVAAKVGVTGPTVRRALLSHPNYRPRRGPDNRRWLGAMPWWLPKQHHDRYRRIAAGNGEEIAADCLRRLKALEAR